MTTPTELDMDLDARGRLPLGKLATSRRYRVVREQDDEIRLIPLTSLTKREIDFLANPEAVARVRQGIAEAEAGLTVSYPFDPALDDEV